MTRIIPGELLCEPGEHVLNAGRASMTVIVENRGDRPIQVGSHYHFAETNPALGFDRDRTRGYRLDIPAGTAVRFEPGQQRTVTLVALAGDRVVYGFRGETNGPLAVLSEVDPSGSVTQAAGRKAPSALPPSLLEETP